MTDQDQAKQYAGELKEALEHVVSLMNSARAKGFHMSFQIAADQTGTNSVGGVQVDRVTRLVS